MSKLSAVVICENEEHIIGDCLRALKFCDEIVVVDGGSTDQTVAIAQEAGAKIIRHSTQEHGIHFNKNLGAQHASGDWILSIDSDEIVPAQLADEIRHELKSPKFSCYRVARRTFFLGKWIKHSGWWPGYVIRLWKKGHTEWPMEVHRVPAANGPYGTLEHPLDHFSYRDLADWGRKVIHFSGCEALETKARGEELKGAALIYALSLRPAMIFMRKLILMSAWRDGLHGVVVAGSAAFAAWLRAARLWELETLGVKPPLGGRTGRHRDAAHCDAAPKTGEE